MEIKDGPILTQLLEANLFSGLGKYESLIYQSALTPKLLQFVLLSGEAERMLYLASVVSADEKMMWQSFQDLLGQSAKIASAGLRGIFGLDVLSADIQEGSRHFNLQDFAALLVNHGRLLGFGQQKLIRYGQIFSLLHKRAPADWGKIDVQYHTEIINPEKTRFQGFLKKMTAAGASNEDAVYLIHDLGLKPVWNLENEEFPASVYFYQSGA